MTPLALGFTVSDKQAQPRPRGRVLGGWGRAEEPGLGAEAD